MTRHTKELLGTVVSCFGAYGMMLSFGLGEVSIARFLLLAGLAAAVLVIALDTIKGYVIRSVVGVSLCCILGFGVGYAPYWYLTQTFADRPLFEFGAR